MQVETQARSVAEDRWSLAGRRIAATAFRRPADRPERAVAEGALLRLWPAAAAVEAQPLLLPAELGASAVRSLSGRIMRARTAVEALHAWCDERAIGAGPVRAIRRAQPTPSAPGAALVEALGLAAGEQLACRQVSLVRGGTILSDADTWYVPGRLLPPVCALVDGTDVPFGAAIAPLEPSRRTTFLRFPEPALRTTGWGAAGNPAGTEAVTLAPSAVVLEIEAVVLDWRRRPLAVVAERYRASLLANVGPGGS